MTSTRFILRSLIIPALFLVLASGCQSGAEEEADTPAAAPEFVRVMVGHAVEDFDEWRERFSGLRESREAAGITDETIFRGMENRNLVFLLARAPSEEAAREFLADPALARSMEFAGVEGAVVQEILAAGESYEVPDTTEQLLLVRHPVRNFDRWMNTFTGHQGERARAGVHEQLVTHPVDDPNDVYMIFGVSDVETVTDYMASDILRLAMRLAGVSGEPQAYFVEKVE